MSAPTFGLCQCGCGERTEISMLTDHRVGTKRWQPKPYIRGHRRRGATRRVCKRTGYVIVLVVGHPRGVGRGWVQEHVVVAERALGKPLPTGALVHHVNGIKTDNRNCNLAILPSQSYHGELHGRMRVRDAGGDPFTQALCCACRQPKDLSEFYPTKDRRVSTICKPCARYRARKKPTPVASEVAA